MRQNLSLVSTETKCVELSRFSTAIKISNPQKKEDFSIKLVLSNQFVVLYSTDDLKISIPKYTATSNFGSIIC